MDSKIISLKDLEKIRSRNQGQKIILVSGCFDLLHIGHVHFLEEAKKQADILIVAVLSDNFVKSRKGEGRPIFSEEHRMGVVASLGVVDFVFRLTREKTSELLEALRPTFYGVGGDRKEDFLPEKELLVKYKVIIKQLSFKHALSTSQILKALSS